MIKSLITRIGEQILRISGALIKLWGAYAGVVACGRSQPVSRVFLVHFVFQSLLKYQNIKIDTHIASSQWFWCCIPRSYMASIKRILLRDALCMLSSRTMLLYKRVVSKEYDLT